jgi:hypothetical protein
MQVADDARSMHAAQGGSGREGLLAAQNCSKCDGAMTMTLEIDADTVRELNEIAHREQKTLGEVISDLARGRAPATAVAAGKDSSGNGLPEFKALPANDRVVTPELIRQLQDEEFGE